MSFITSSNDAGAPKARARAQDASTPSSVAENGRRWLWAAVAVFLAAKFAWALVPAAVMGVPRLGDDALVYLWSGASSVLEPRLDRPAIRDIVQLRQAQDNPSAALEFARARVTMRTTGVTASPVSLLAGGLLHTGASHRLTFALVEAAVALALALGIAYSLSGVVSRGAAAATLSILALAILPNQGLHYLIGSVFVLAAGLFLWTLVLKEPGWWPLVLLVALVMLLAHPIGLVYVLVAVTLIAGQVLLQRRLGRQRIMSLVVLAASVPLWLMINEVIGVQAPVTAGMGGFSLAAVPANAAGLFAHLRTLVLTQPIILVLLLAGLLLAVKQRRENPDAFLLAGVLAGVVVTTVIVDLPGYPGELPSRALVGLVIVCTGIAAHWILEATRGLQRRSRWIAGGLVAIAVTQAPMFLRYGMDNINSRHQIYDAALLRHEVAALGPGATVVWPDTDLTMMAALLAGADRLRAVPYPMLSGPSALGSATAGASQVYVATSVPERLSGTSTIGAWSLQPRFYGYGFAWFQRVTLQASGASALPAYLRIEGADEVALRVSNGEGRRCQLQSVAEPGWFGVGGCGNRGVLHIESDSHGARLTGLGMDKPDPVRPWPWGEGELRMRAEPRNGGEAPELSFGFAYLLGEGTAKALTSELGPLRLVSSRSGIVWLQVQVSPTKS